MQNWHGGTDVFTSVCLSCGSYAHFWLPCHVNVLYREQAILNVAEHPYIYTDLEHYDPIAVDVGWHELTFLPTHP
jgi:hypothetical protein